MTSFRSNQDYRLSSGSFAPEIDHSRQAPEAQGDNVAPEVAPGSGAQVFYDNHPPEVTAINHPEDTSHPEDASEAQTPSRKPRKASFIISFAVALALIAVALGIGIGLGLERHGKNDLKGTIKPSSTTVTSSQPSVITTSGSAYPSATKRALQHGIMDNTSIVALTLPNNNRHVYFQEKTGAFRRAIYSSQAKLWRTVLDPQLPPDSNDETPLAGVTGLNIFQGERGYFFSDPYEGDDNTVTLFYVNSTNHLSCVNWGQDAFWSCSIAAIIPNTSVEAGSRHISATILITSTDEGGLLMTYQDSFERRVILLGFVETTASHRKWTWRNETGQLNVALGSSSGSNRITACTAGPNTASFSTTILYFLNCFGESLEKSHPGPEMLHFWLNFTSTGNLAITLEDIEYSVTNGDSEPTIDSDITPLKQGAGVFLNQSTPQWGFGFQTGGVPLSSLRFPFNRLASTFADNATSTYLYHQLTDTILAEELWDGTSAFWIQSNVTIETS